MKKSKIIVPALGMLLLSTAASVSGTVAWFASNNKVTASGMAVTAKVDSAVLVISGTSTLGSLDTFGMNVSGSVLPTTTADNGATWKTGIGQSASNGAASGDLSTLTIAEDAGLGSVGDNDYYVYSNFYIGLAAGSAATDKEIMADVTFNATASSELNKSFTVLIVIGSKAESYNYNSATGQTKKTGTTRLITTGGVTTTATAVKVYAYFDGEHASCTTNNAQNLDAINVSIDFNLVDKAA